MSALLRVRSIATIAVALSISVAGIASAQETAPPPVAPIGAVAGSVGYFGEHGQVAVGVDLKLDIVHTSYSSVGGAPGTSGTEYLIQPSADYFASTNVSLGGALTLQKQGVGGSEVTTFGLGVRGGYNIFLTGPLSLWIRGGLAYQHFSFGGTPSTSGYAIPFTLYAPVLWHPVSHFFIGLGPVFQTDLVSKFEGANAPKVTQFGLQSTIGGYFGGL